MNACREHMKKKGQIYAMPFSSVKSILERMRIPMLKDRMLRRRVAELKRGYSWTKSRPLMGNEYHYGI